MPDDDSATTPKVPRPPARKRAAPKAAPYAPPSTKRPSRVPAPPMPDAKAAPKAPTLALVPEAPPAEPVVKAPMLRKKDLVDRVVLAVGGKKKGVKEIVEATLAALGDALSRGDGLNLPPLGRAHVNRQRDLDGGEMMIVKLRRDADGASTKRKTPPDEDGE